jgi:hypothetical protein
MVLAAALHPTSVFRCLVKSDGVGCGISNQRYLPSARQRRRFLSYRSILSLRRTEFIKIDNTLETLQLTMSATATRFRLAAWAS